MGGGNPANGPVDTIVAEILAGDPELDRLKHRLKPRVQTLLSAGDAEFMRWGQENLAVAQTHSATLAKVAQRLSQLNVAEWVRKCQEASTRTDSGGLLGMFRSKEDPAAYERRLQQLKYEMEPMVQHLAVLLDEVRPELEDLRLDAAALSGVAPRHAADAGRSMLISNRVRTLVTGQQTAAQLVIAAENTRTTVIQNLQSMDQLLTVTIPAWRIAQQ